MLCRVAEVSRKCYYNHLKSPKGIEDAEILKEIRFQQEKVQRNFFALEPRKRMVEDITYLYGKEKRMYLNTIADLFNGENLAYSISDSPDSKLCIDTVRLLCQTWGECFEGAILHNDLGSTYVSYEYMNEVKAHGIRQSIGRVASCYDNAAMESLNGIIKLGTSHTSVVTFLASVL